MSRYTEIPTKKWARIKWRPSRMNLQNYLDLPCECANCEHSDHFDQFMTEMEGTGMRLMVRCPSCNEKSVIKVKGLFKVKLVTEGRVPKTVSFAHCKICGKSTSKTGNYTNMILAKVQDPKEFHEQYGMMCAKHAGELTQQIVKENNLTEKDFEKATELAKELVMKDFKI